MSRITCTLFLALTERNKKLHGSNMSGKKQSNGGNLEPPCHIFSQECKLLFFFDSKDYVSETNILNLYLKKKKKSLHHFNGQEKLM